MANPGRDPEALREFYESWVEAGRPQVAPFARKVGKEPDTARRWLNQYVASLGLGASVEAARAAMQGFAPDHDMTVTVPSPFVVSGTTSLYKDGALKLQWVKTKLDASRVESVLREFVEHLVQGARGLSPDIAPPEYSDDDLLAVYPMGDPHFGMYAWAAETGDDFDLEHAERLTCAAIDRLVASAPASTTALLAELGDFFHADNESNQTTRSGNTLDVDTRWARVMQVGLRAMIYCITRLLAKHKTVIVRIVKGNHDGHSSFALALALDAFFSNNDRVTIDLSPAAHWYFRFGRVLLGLTHGDTNKMADLPSIMADDRPEEWGATKFRYWYQGHIHHQDTKEYRGCVVEAFRTLASKDAWHTAAGYRAGRDMRCIVHHKDYGEIERHRCDIAMLTQKEVA